MMFQFLCVVTFQKVFISYIALVFQFLCVVTIELPNSTPPIVFSFSFFVLLHYFVIRFVVDYFVFQFLCVVTFIKYDSLFSTNLVLVSLCCYNSISLLCMKFNFVLVSLCCYNNTTRYYNTTYVFQFLCVVTRTYREFATHLLVLVSLCCYIANSPFPATIVEFQFLCVVTRS